MVETPIVWTDYGNECPTVPSLGAPKNSMDRVKIGKKTRKKHKDLDKGLIYPQLSAAEASAKGL
jgi:hypothetical protein